MPASASGRLFPTDLPETEWVEFPAQGFSAPVSGIIYRLAHPPCCGVALGGLGTGCLDLETAGVFGFSTIFPAARCKHDGWPHAMYVNPRIALPFLGLAVGGKTWVLAAQKFIAGGAVDGCVEPGMEGALLGNPDWIAHWRSDVPRIEDVEPATEIHYWGHYPVADLEYETTAPISVGLRAWASFLPGDAAASNIPGAVFEVHVRNSTDMVQQGTLGFSFPGPNPGATAAGGKQFVRKQVAEAVERLWETKPEEFRGVTITSPGGEIGYALGVIGPERVRFGAALSSHPAAWSKLATELPAPAGQRPDKGRDLISSDAGASLAVDFELQPRQEKAVRIVLTWYAPDWAGGVFADIAGFEQPERWPPSAYEIPGRGAEAGERYTAMYAMRYRSALEIARRLTRDHASLLRHILAWQQEIYVSQELPVWLRDCLVNNLSLLAEDSMWAQPQEPLDDWAFPYGAFGLVESPRGCPVMGCVASNFYGDLPLTYFFPELDKMLLRNYRRYMRPDGAAVFLYPWGDFTKPVYEWQIALNGSCFVDLVDRLWRRTGDDELLREFYPAIKQATTFTMNLKPIPEGIISVPREGNGQEWWEFTPVWGRVTHVAGIHLAHLRIAQRMAERMGDHAFARQCQEWFDQGSQLMETTLWAGRSYLLFSDPVSGKSSDLIMSSQLDGEWVARLHGLPGVFRPERVRQVLDTIKETCQVDCGVAGFASAEGAPQLAAYGTFPPEINIVAMTYLYQWQKDLGLEIVRRNLDNLVRKQRHPWDLPNLIRCDTGQRQFGTDYYQNMILWALPAALEGEDLAGPCAPGALVDRLLRAAREA